MNKYYKGYDIIKKIIKKVNIFIKSDEKFELLYKIKKLSYLDYSKKFL